MYRCFTVVFAAIMVSGCFSWSMRIVSSDFGLRNNFFEELTIPYNAPQRSQELCKSIVNALDVNDTSAFTQEIYDYLQSPDFTSFSFQKNTFIGMSLCYVLTLKQRNLNEANFLNITYQKNTDSMIVIFHENGQIQKFIEITDQAFKEKIYAVEKKYQEYIEEGKSIM